MENLSKYLEQKQKGNTINFKELGTFYSKKNLNTCIAKKIIDSIQPEEQITILTDFNTTVLQFVSEELQKTQQYTVKILIKNDQKAILSFIKEEREIEINLLSSYYLKLDNCRGLSFKKNLILIFDEENLYNTILEKRYFSGHFIPSILYVENIKFFQYNYNQSNSYFEFKEIDFDKLEKDNE